MKYRLYNWMYALAHGYYWTPCPVCGRRFGAHESAQDYSGIWLTGGTQNSVCRDCGDSAALHRINITRFESGLVCDAPVNASPDPMNFREMIYTRRPGEQLCPSCQSTLNHAKKRLTEIEHAVNTIPAHGR